MSRETHYQLFPKQHSIKLLFFIVLCDAYLTDFQKYAIISIEFWKGGIP